MTKTYVDASLLIAAARGENEVAERALAILDDPARQFIGSVFLQLEVIPKPIYNGYQEEAAFYEAFFRRCLEWVGISASLTEVALVEAQRHGLSAVDALHIVGAHSMGADVLVTAEKSEKTLHRSVLLPIHTIAS
jgi:hypothetical protein